MTQTTTMQAVTATKAGGPEVLELREVGAPSAGPGQALIDVAWAGINFIDTYRRSGIYPVQFPDVPGTEGSGTVVALGEGAGGADDSSTRIAVGDRVAWCDPPGSYAQQVVLPADRLLPVPKALDFATAAALPLQGMTAHYLCTASHRVREGDTLVVTAAAGGVGRLLTQLAAARGARVIGTVGSPEKVEAAREAGAAEVIVLGDLREADGRIGDGYPQRVRELTGGQGAHAVYDGIGKDTFDGSLAAVRRRGTLVVFGGASGQVPPFDIQRLNAAGSIFLTRPTLADHVATRGELLERWSEVAGRAADGSLSVLVGGRWPLAQAAAAHEALESGSTRGKLLLEVAGG